MAHRVQGIPGGRVELCVTDEIGRDFEGGTSHNLGGLASHNRPYVNRRPELRDCPDAAKHKAMAIMRSLRLFVCPQTYTRCLSVSTHKQRPELTKSAPAWSLIEVEQLKQRTRRTACIFDHSESRRWRPGRTVSSLDQPDPAARLLSDGRVTGLV